VTPPHAAHSARASGFAEVASTAEVESRPAVARRYTGVALAGWSRGGTTDPMPEDAPRDAMRPGARLGDGAEGGLAGPHSGSALGPATGPLADAGAASVEEDAVDRDLVRRAQTGEEEAFANLVRRHQRRAVRVARSMVPNDEDAQDLAQEAFLRVFRSLDRFDFQHAFTTWLYRIVTNLCIDHLRRRRTTMSMTVREEDAADLDLEDPADERPSDQLESEETADEVRAVLATLAPHFQSVLTLREIEGLACTEIAEIVGATHVTVRWRLHRGRKLFQEEWERRQRLRDARGEGRATDEPQGPGPHGTDGHEHEDEVDSDSGDAANVSPRRP
jgi:RNA polymerase sigma-70 factor (ECF subfamily)